MSSDIKQVVIQTQHPHLFNQGLNLIVRLRFCVLSVGKTTGVSLFKEKLTNEKKQKTFESLMGPKDTVKMIGIEAGKDPGTGDDLIKVPHRCAPIPSSVCAILRNLKGKKK